MRIKVQFEWDSSKYGSKELLPEVTELWIIPPVGLEIENEATGMTWQVSRVVWVIAENSEEDHLLIFVR